MRPLHRRPCWAYAALCKGLAVKQREGCRGCRAASGLQPLPDNQGLGVGKLGSKKGCQVAAPLLRKGGKQPILWDCWHRVGASMPGSAHTASFCLRLLSLALQQAAAFPGTRAARLAWLWQGEDSGCGTGRGGRDDAGQSHSYGCAVAGLGCWRCERVQLERRVRDCSGGYPGRCCWKKASGCRGVMATAVPDMPQLWAQGREQNRTCSAVCCFPCRDADLRAVLAATSACSSRLAPGGNPSPHGAPKNSRQHSHSVGVEPHVWGSSCPPTNGTDTAPLCWEPYVNVFVWCSQGDCSPAAGLGSLQKQQGVKGWMVLSSQKLLFTQMQPKIRCLCLAITLLRLIPLHLPK